ncbi:MAG: aldo/keto reductase [Bacillota bacterium]
MDMVILGRTGIIVNKNAFGALPIQRRSTEDAVYLLRKAYENGFRFFDTARFYTDSEEKIGIAFRDIREEVFIASKTMTTEVDEFWEQLNTSLKNLGTDYLDLYQFHNPSFCPKPGDGSGLYEAMVEAKDKGMILHIGLTNHRIEVATEGVESGLYETIQFPFSYLATDEEIELVKLCESRDVGFIAMKSLAGGLITDSTTAYAYLAQFEGVLPIWGIQTENELDEFISYNAQPPLLNNARLNLIQLDRKKFQGEFCRGCGYCLPCPANIDIPNAARMSLLIRRAPTSIYLNEDWQRKMKMIEDCTHCNHCKNHCPYGLDTPRLLQDNWADYKEFT